MALAFFNEPFAEDKLAGVLFLQNFLYDKLPWKFLLGKYEDIYANRCIFDWNICDWFCVRVLGPTIKYNGSECAGYIVDWKDAEYLWQARSSVVAFVNLSSDAQYYPYIQEACVTLIRREERFAKTSVGWVLRDISKHDEHFVESFIEKNLTFFSKESLNNALKYFDEEKKVRYLQNLKKKNKVAGAPKYP